MKQEAKEHILRVFCEHHNASNIDFIENLKQLVSETYAPFLLFTECLDSADFKARNNPCDGFFINMLHRASNIFAGMAMLIASGHLQEAEILSRSLAESSLKIMHLCKGDVTSNFATYLANYFDESKSKLKKWQEVDSKLTGAFHNKLILSKADTEDKVQVMCREFIEDVGGKWPEKIKSINIEKLFKDLDKEVDYRTVYRAMCGSSHQNPEDMVNSLISSLVDCDELERRRLEEKHCFSIFICLWGMRYHLESIDTLASYFSFNSVMKQSESAIEKIIEFQVIFTDAMQAGRFPTGWVKNTVNGI